MHMDTFIYSCMWDKCVKGDRELQNFMCHLYLILMYSVYGTPTCHSPCSLWFANMLLYTSAVQEYTVQTETWIIWKEDFV